MSGHQASANSREDKVDSATSVGYFHNRDEIRQVLP